MRLAVPGHTTKCPASLNRSKAGRVQFPLPFSSLRIEMLVNSIWKNAHTWAKERLSMWLMATEDEPPWLNIATVRCSGSSTVWR